MLRGMNENILLIASTEKDANLYYAARFLAPDDIIYAQIQGKKYLLLSDLEVDRGKSQARVDEVLSLTRLAREVKAKGLRPTTIEVVDSFLKGLGAQTLTVPYNFPLGYAESLRGRGYTLKPKEDPFFEERTVKTPDEIAAITETQRHTEYAVQAAVERIAESVIKNGQLIYKDKALTSEDLKQIINVKLMERGCVAEHTIASCGIQCTDPHNEGSGPLKANEPIIMDVFPKSGSTRYFADMTRTVVRGKAHPKLMKIYELVREGQEIAFERIKPGADGYDIHTAIQKLFDDAGFKTGEQDGRMQGFFHGTGHGVGLDIHEAPRVSAVHDILQENHVVTVEPGLYYTDVGGVRLEDMVVVTKTGNTNLTLAPKILEV